MADGAADPDRGSQPPAHSRSWGYVLFLAVAGLGYGVIAAVHYDGTARWVFWGVWVVVVGLIIWGVRLLRRREAVQEARLADRVKKLGFEATTKPSAGDDHGLVESSQPTQPDLYAPSWYPDAARPGHWRYFDGQQWTTLTR